MGKALDKKLDSKVFELENTFTKKSEELNNLMQENKKTLELQKNLDPEFIKELELIRKKSDDAETKISKSDQKLESSIKKNTDKASQIEECFKKEIKQQKEDIKQQIKQQKEEIKQQKEQQKEQQ